LDGLMLHLNNRQLRQHFRTERKSSESELSSVQETMSWWINHTCFGV